jgi:alpha-mannosidase/mannosylglycerate hydrolase
MTRNAHYIRSTHWDREWYQPFQGYRMRLVSMLDEVLETFGKDPQFRFMMDGQAIPLVDFLEVRAEMAENIQRYAREGRLKIGPWYVQPDEWLVSGESLIRNLQIGIETAASFGGIAQTAGFVCDQFGHIGQLPQIFDQLGLGSAYVWRGTLERPNQCHFLWQSPDGTAIPTYRFGRKGYGTLAYEVRDVFAPEKPLDVSETVERLVKFTKQEAARSKLPPILLFDGADHLEIEPKMAEIITAANERLVADGIHIIPSDLDAYQAEVQKNRAMIEDKIVGELRETAVEFEDQYAIGGCLSSRIHLKRRNAVCEDELSLWAEPFSTFASEKLSRPYPASYLRLAWKQLIENHPHDSICGCSIDQVHQDMLYRFDQSIEISSRLTEQALRAITTAAAKKPAVEGSLTIGVFNATGDDIDEPIDLNVELPTNWPTKFAEFFKYEDKFGFKLRGPGGEEIPYQLVRQRRDVNGFNVSRYKFPTEEKRHIISVCAKVAVPALGYTTLTVEPVDAATRYPGSMMTSHHTMENEFLNVTVNSNGTLTVLDKRSKKAFDQLLTFEQRADIGDGWFHGVAVNDEIYTSVGCRADVATIADGIGKVTMRVDVTMQVPAAFDFRAMRRESRKSPLRIVSDVTLRAGSDRIEINTTVHNTVLDHRLRVLFPTGLDGEKYWCDGAFDCIERPVATADNSSRRELDLETRPQTSWTAFGDGRAGLAVVSRGLPESAVIDRADRPIALTLLRAFRKAVFSNDNFGGQIQGEHVFRYEIVPFAGAVTVKKLFVLGQRVNSPHRQVTLHPLDRPTSQLPPTQSLATARGEAVVTSIQHTSGGRLMRMFNPTSKSAAVDLGPFQSVKSVALGSREDAQTKIDKRKENFVATIPAKRIATLLIVP